MIRIYDRRRLCKFLAVVCIALALLIIGVGVSGCSLYNHNYKFSPGRVQENGYELKFYCALVDADAPVIRDIRDSTTAFWSLWINCTVNDSLLGVASVTVDSMILTFPDSQKVLSCSPLEEDSYVSKYPGHSETGTDYIWGCKPLMLEVLHSETLKLTVVGSLEYSDNRPAIQFRYQMDGRRIKDRYPAYLVAAPGLFGPLSGNPKLAGV